VAEPRAKTLTMATNPPAIRLAGSGVPTTTDLPVAVHHAGFCRTARLVVRPLRETDRTEFLRVLKDDHGAGRQHIECCAGFARLHETDEQLFERHLMQTRDGDRTGSAWRRMGFSDDGHLVGGFNLATISRGLVLEADATWWVVKSACNAGFATEGVQAMLDIAARDLPDGLGLHRINAAIKRDNEPSRRLARRLGFTHEPGETLSIQHAGEWIAHDLWIKSLL
jgi:RimJ/RimL family protein N-acetyltransferase